MPADVAMETATDDTDKEQCGPSKDATNIGCGNNIHVAEGLSKEQCAYYNALVYRTARSLVVLTTEQTTALATKQVVGPSRKVLT